VRKLDIGKKKSLAIFLRKIFEVSSFFCPKPLFILNTYLRRISSIKIKERTSQFLLAVRTT
jgi:hypothetical protein